MLSTKPQQLRFGHFLYDNQETIFPVLFVEVTKHSKRDWSDFQEMLNKLGIFCAEQTLG